MTSNSRRDGLPYVRTGTGTSVRSTVTGVSSRTLSRRWVGSGRFNAKLSSRKMWRLPGSLFKWVVTETSVRMTGTGVTLRILSGHLTEVEYSRYQTLVRTKGSFGDLMFRWRLWLPSEYPESVPMSELGQDLSQVSGRSVPDPSHNRQTPKSLNGSYSGGSLDLLRHGQVVDLCPFGRRLKLHLGIRSRSRRLVSGPQSGQVSFLYILSMRDLGDHCPDDSRLRWRFGRRQCTGPSLWWTGVRTSIRLFVSFSCPLPEVDGFHQAFMTFFTNE